MPTRKRVSYYPASHIQLARLITRPSQNKSAASGIIKLKCVAKLQVGRGKKMIVCGSAAVSDVCCSWFSLGGQCVWVMQRSSSNYHLTRARDARCFCSLAGVPCVCAWHSKKQRFCSQWAPTQRRPVKRVMDEC